MTTNQVVTASTADQPSTEASPLTPQERAFRDWCRITASLIPYGLSKHDLMVICDAKLFFASKSLSQVNVPAFEREAEQCPPIPEHIKRLLDEQDDGRMKA